MSAFEIDLVIRWIFEHRSVCLWVHVLANGKEKDRGLIYPIKPAQ